MAVDQLEQQWMHFAYKRTVMAFLIAGAGDFDLALEMLEMVIELARRADYDAPGYAREYKVQLLARAGYFDEAEELAQTLRKDIEEYDELDMGIYWHAAGWIDYERGDHEASVVAFEKSLENQRRTAWRYMLGRAYLESGRLGEAVATLERVLSRYNNARLLFLSADGVKAHYRLGLAYEQSGWTKKAIEQYEEFLDIWKDADPGIPEIEDARRRVAHLKGGE
jgi:tetratricopeptide (TPR) repeat protein